jgi:hypothetical protein
MFYDFGGINCSSCKQYIASVSSVHPVLSAWYQIREDTVLLGWVPVLLCLFLCSVTVFFRFPSSRPYEWSAPRTSHYVRWLTGFRKPRYEPVAIRNIPPFITIFATALTALPFEIVMWNEINHIYCSLFKICVMKRCLKIQSDHLKCFDILTMNDDPS